tara:strand:+ start:905 stop:1006 length:102 start_codon:yes stop_codon:yes gene_type:complete
MIELGIAIMKSLRELIKALYGMVVLWFRKIEKD